MEKIVTSPTSRDIHLGDSRLHTFFIDHLNHIYCAKAHIVQSFPNIAAHAHFTDLKHAIIETMENVEKQIARMEQIFKILGTKMSVAACTGLTAMLEEAIKAIKHQSSDGALRDMSILFYLQNIESVEMASFKVLQVTAAKLKNKEIIQLLRESYDEAKEDRALLLLISKKYISS
ncbi:DUF892 family protein [Mucilaginibacter sp. HMF5004]|uniref:YciE/YciF ferroxidase family protein n=1 Tax=Mucilaginibacter rivuli TaxID=2857527 RepID=UPI001C5CD79B|nr:DUF892 family protein [Mucilaginibacter rivuli]MBW4888634.1 DUF892 family protein [Mucilaginibacter rivuli]